MVTVGYLIRLQVKPGNEMDVERALQKTLARVQQEPGIIAWFACRLGPSTFAIFDAFLDEQSLQAHFSEEALAQMQRADEWLARSRVMEKVDILAAKLPKRSEDRRVTIGLLTRYDAKPGKEASAECSLKEAVSAIQQEPGTTAWFALRLGPSTFGVFDAFLDEEGRQAHLSAGTARLKEKAADIVEQSLVMEKVDVFAARLP